MTFSLPLADFMILRNSRPLRLVVHAVEDMMKDKEKEETKDQCYTNQEELSLCWLKLLHMEFHQPPREEKT